MFKQAKQNRVFEDVILQIQEAILNGILKAGDRLPAERELKKLFQTSRGTLREALRVLEQKGLIEIKTGVSGGAFVKTVSSHQVSESLDILLRSQKVSLKDLAEFREDVEGIVTGHAAEMADKNQIAVLREILEAARGVMDQDEMDWDTFIENDNNFHMELARITGNYLYIIVLKIIHDNINPYYNQFLEKNRKILRDNFQDMYEIVKAVEEGDAAKAKILAQEHVKKFNSHMVLAEKKSHGAQSDIGV